MPGVVLTVEGLCDFDFVSRRYILDNGGTQEIVLAPWRFRPTLLVGFALTAAGETRFASRSMP
jgi:hypothetical protein